jgi:TonB-linked SusC/RagA family outer membrane protein
MKRITASLIIACLLFSATVVGQQINFSNKRATLTDIRKALEKQAKYSIISTTKTTTELRPVSIHLKNASVKELLDAFFKDQPYTYEIFGQMVTIVARPQSAQLTHLVTIKGKISNEQGEPIPGATILVNGSNKFTATNDNGEFTLSGVDTNFNIVISSINYESQEINWQGDPEVEIRLKHRVSELNSVQVVSNGYQKQTKEKATGSYAKIDNELFNRRVSTNVLERLDGVTSGLIFNKNINPNTNQSAISIRGRSTIFANPNPLIVLDNFPYTGNIDNINPNDVESITVLKDAEAASLWGAFSGNGVIIITTKKGKYEQPLRLSFNSNVTVGNKPDLYYEPVLSSADYIEVEKFLFDNGYYNSVDTDPNHSVVSPAVELFFKRKKGLMSEAEADAALNELRNQNKRTDLEKYFYRKSVNQQYSVNASGGSNNNHYYFSVGYDKNLTTLKRNENDRLTLTANNTFSWFKKKLEFNTGIIFTESNVKNNNTGDVNLRYPYLKLADAYGVPLPVPLDVRQSFKDTAGGGKLLDWDYRPLEEFKLNDNSTKTTDYRINADVKLVIVKGLDINALYQFNRGFIEQNDYKSQQTYFTRNLINQFSEIDSTGQLIHHIPLGGILDQSSTEYEAHNVRTQINYNHSWYNQSHTKHHLLTALAGAEVRSIKSQLGIIRSYGYKKDIQTSEEVRYGVTYPLFHAPSDPDDIPYRNFRRGTVDNYISYYVNAKYIFQRRYILSANARKDESNIFGVKTNQKGVPLWSVGVSWELSQENFYRIAWLPFLKLRITNGYNGNVDKSVSAYTTAQIERPNIWRAIPASIVNPPNPSLRWEKNQMVNFGVDFATKDAVIEGSLEYYIRKGTDLIGESPLDPTTGNTTFRGNTADMKGKGIDIVIRSKNIDKQFKWYSALLFSYATDKVTNYKVNQDAIWFYCDPQYISPLEGKPLYSIFGFKWMGLDSLSGDPLGYWNKEASKDYTSIIGSKNLSDLIYRGPANPVYFGSIRNTFSYKELELSFNVTWKLGYYFRRNSIDYTNLLYESGPGHTDFNLRWQKRGDEKITSVPSMEYPISTVNRSRFYKYSDVLIEKGDHIRLQDLQLSYELNKDKIKRLPMQTLRIYVYANNLGILWKANDKGIDPDYISISAIPNPRSYAIGVKVDL